MKHRTLLVSIVAASLAACGTPGEASDAPSAETIPAPTDGTIRIEQNGGCAMIGPNCPTWVLSPDGTFTVSRTGIDGVEGTGSIDAGLSERLFAEVAATDFDVLVPTLGPGECQACFDGVDTVVEIDAGGARTTLDSTEIGFDASLPLFSAVDAVIRAMSAEIPLETVSR